MWGVFIIGIISRNVFKELIGIIILSGPDFELLSLGATSEPTSHNFWVENNRMGCLMGVRVAGGGEKEAGGGKRRWEQEEKVKGG